MYEVVAQAQYRAALALEKLGRTADAVQRAERALSMQSSADRGSVDQISALIDRLRRPAASRTNSSKAGQSGSETPDTQMTDAFVSEGRDDGFLWSAAPKLASASTVVHGPSACVMSPSCTALWPLIRGR